MTEQKNNTYLEVNNLSKSFGNFEAIKNIGIDIKEGEFVCFLGPSGCGKTTLLRLIAGFEHIVLHQQTFLKQEGHWLSPYK